MDFHHPFEPYEIQRDFMTALYQCLDDGKVGIFESPTGTGKSLSLICGSLTWLRDHKRKQFEQNMAQASADGEEPEWMVEHERRERRREALQHREEFEARLRRVREKEARLQKQAKDFEQSRKRQKASQDVPQGDEEDSYLLDDYESDDGRSLKPSQSRVDQNGFTAETQALMAKLGMSLGTTDAGEDVDNNDELKILFCSRTHSQLTQFASELRKVHLPPIIPPEPSDGGTRTQTSDPNIEEEIKHLTLGSRKNLCINAKVTRLNDATLINERCLELQQAKTDSRHACPYLPKKEKEHAVSEFKDHALAKIRDIEDLAGLGKRMGVCPYYASRAALKPSEIVTLPYPLLLQRSAREALGISLKDHVIIIDEAHNLMDAIAGMYSVTITHSQVKLARTQLMMYLQKFRNRLKGKNRVYVAQAVRLIDSIVAYMDGLTTSNKPNERVISASDLIAGKGVDQINLYKLSRYLQESKLARKVAGYIVYTAEQDRSDDSTAGANGTPVLMRIQSFLLALMNPSVEGRFFASVSGEHQGAELRYMLLDPTNHFRDIVEEARAVVLAGGTMSPMSDYSQHLFSYLDSSRIMTLSCGHVIPPTSLLACPITNAARGAEFDFTFEKRMLSSTINDLGLTILAFAQDIPDGVIVFFPSYAYLDYCIKMWQGKARDAGSQSLWQRLAAVKPLFTESRSKTDGQNSSSSPQPGDHVSSRDSLLDAYSSAITSSNGCGALLFAVINGTLSEGINFSDALGRGVMVVGLPFPNPHTAEWKAKMEFVTQKQGKEAARDFFTNTCMRAVNQAVGRAIRHKGDYAAILLLDRRYGTKAIQDKLPGWIQSSLQPGMGSQQAGEKLKAFFRDKLST